MNENEKTNDEIPNEKSAEKPVEKTTEKSPKKNPVLTKIILRVVTIVLILGAAYFGTLKLKKVTIEKKYATIEKQISRCAELVSLKYNYTDIVAIKKSNAVSKSYSIVKYSGIVRAGIADVSKCEFMISPDGKTISVKIPETEILGNEICNQEIFDEKLSIFVPIKTQEIFDEIESSKSLALEKIIEEGFLEDAATHAKEIVLRIIESIGFESIEFI